MHKKRSGGSIAMDDKNAVVNNVPEGYGGRTYIIKCPKCNHEFQAAEGTVVCPECGAEIEFSVDVD
jgi:Zn finger protein HypA/HybF involved in hydrogenase expression